MKLSSCLYLFLSAVGIDAFAPQLLTGRSPAIAIAPTHQQQTATTTTRTTALFMSTEISVNDITADAEERMDKSVESVKLNLSTIRTGRASSNMLDRVKVDYYGMSIYDLSSSILLVSLNVLDLSDLLTFLL